MNEQLIKEICELVKRQSNFWVNTNDLKSPTHLNDIEEDVNSIDGLAETDAEELVELVSNLYWFVRKFKI